jgi:hypothetical protein
MARQIMQIGRSPAFCMGRFYGKTCIKTAARFQAHANPGLLSWQVDMAPPVSRWTRQGMQGADPAPTGKAP